MNDFCASPYGTDPAEIIESLKAEFGLQWLVYLYRKHGLPWFEKTRNSVNSSISRKKKGLSADSDFDFLSWRCEHHKSRFLPTVNRWGEAISFLEETAQLDQEIEGALFLLHSAPSSSSLALLEQMELDESSSGDEETEETIDVEIVDLFLPPEDRVWMFY